jgi:ketosteroid isomerase-like protein
MQHANDACERARQDLIRTDEAWATAASAGQDADLVASYWSDDATIVPAGAPLVVGKSAIREYVAESFATPGFRIHWTTLDATVSDDASMGYTTADTTMTFPGPAGDLISVSGRGVVVWRRDAAGDWKCVCDIWNHGAA